MQNEKIESLIQRGQPVMKSVSKTVYVCVLMLLALPAFAHPGHGAESGFMSGALHPLFGIDHLLAMVAVGIWAVQLGSRAMWMVPVSFCAAMTAGAALGYAGIALPLVEPVIAMSVLILGLLVVSAAALRPLHGATLIAVFALFHGAAHSAESGAGIAPLAFMAGVVLTTVALHFSGAAIAALFRSRVRLAGLPLIVTGAWLASRAFV
jgi:urease accessory protein